MGLLVLALAAGCSDDRAEQDDAAARDRQQAACSDAVRDLVSTTQRYVDSFTAPGGDDPGVGGTLSDDEYSAAVEDVRSFASSNGCRPREFEEQVEQGLEQVTATSALGRAVLLQLRADPAGRARTAAAAPGDDLAAVLAGLPVGSTLELAAGTYELQDPLLLLRGVTLRGASRDTTVLTSASGEGVLLVLTGAPTAVEGVELRRTGEEPGAVVLAGPSSRLTLTGVRVTGARAEDDGSGGAGVLLAPSDQPLADEGLQRATTLRLVGSELLGNESAGVVVAAGHRAEVDGTLVSAAGQCGICFLDRSDGVVSGSTLTDNAVGLLAAGTARPALTGNTVRGGEVGVQLGERAEPVLTGNEVTSSARAAVIVTDQVRGRIDGNRCADVPAGIVVGPAATPFVGENTGCDVVRGQQ